MLATPQKNSILKLRAQKKYQPAFFALIKSASVSPT